MIFLIDDKKLRQSGYGWDNLKIEKFIPFLEPIYSYDQILHDNTRERIFSPGSIVIFHESFFDAESNRHAKDSITIRIELEKYAKKTDDFKLVFFSGSKNSRSQDKNVIYLPVSTLYKNLENFVLKCSKGDSDLRYLLYGSNPVIEEYLTNAYLKANNELDELSDYNSVSENLYIRPFQNFIQKPLLNFDEQTIFNKVSDDDLNDLVLKWLSHKTYENVFIPLCFGPVLSDFNGLRLALHIRTTKTLNQFSNIFIYGVVDHTFLLDNEYFDILKTKNVNIINYRRSSFQESLFKNLTPLLENELANELEKINLNPPKNYEDNHSIANEWSIMRWFKTIIKSEIIDYTPDEIETIDSKINSNLYYKYLTCKFPINNVQDLTIEDLKLKFNGKILYIDDEKDKGWNELFCALFYDNVINKVEDYESLGSEFHELEREEIINLSVNKAKDFDLVILDFRLTEDDFYESDPKKITGYKILEGIKAHNKGIQVVIFSATNKVWNLQALQDAGADGFIIKESPENAVDPEFTKESIGNIVSLIDKGLSLKFLKTFIDLIDEIKSHFDSTSGTFLNQQTLQLENNYSRFQNEIMNQLIISYDCLSNCKKGSIIKEYNQKYLDLTLISLFKILELFNFKYINNPQLISIRFNGRNLNGEKPSTLDKTAYVIQNVLRSDINTVIGNLEIYNDMRNDIIHPRRNSRQRKCSPDDLINFMQILKSLIFKTE